ncbi:hypothetical protein Brsp07_04594 [Brucella sp. NBRC 14130]|uniref:hypothetical protein n=1 Tax=Brucella sp. NBRC 14130 TaxID=3075483 RepID=UPI0030ADC6D9
MATKWFDFGDEATVRLRKIGSDVTLRLELATMPPAEIVRRALDAYWKRANNEAGVVFDHYGPVSKLSEVSEHLSCFFGPDRVRAALVERGMPKLEINAPTAVKEDVQDKVQSLLAGLPGAPAGLIEHAKRTVELAGQITSARLGAAKVLPFEGRGFEVYDELVRLGGDYDAALVWASAVHAAARHGDGWESAVGEVMDMAAGGRFYLTEIPEAVAQFCARSKEAVEIVAEVTGEKPPLAAVLRGDIVQMLGDGLGYRAYDGALVQPKGAPDLGTAKYRPQAGVSMEIAAEAKSRISAAMGAAARAIGLPKDALFGVNSVTFNLTPVVSRRSAGTAGQASIMSYRNAEHQLAAGSITISPTRPAALVHEIGHQIHYGGNASEIAAAVERHPFMRDVRIITSRLEERQFITAKYGEYLNDPYEVFARAFDEFVVAQNPDAAAYGGCLAACKQSNQVPGGEALKAFMGDMRRLVVESHAEVRAAAEAKSRAQNAAKAGPTPMAMGI